MCLTPNLVSALKVYIQSKLLQHAPFVVGASSGRDQTFCPRTEEREGKKCSRYNICAREAPPQ